MLSCVTRLSQSVKLQFIKALKPAPNSKYAPNPIDFNGTAYSLS